MCVYIYIDYTFYLKFEGACRIHTCKVSCLNSRVEQDRRADFDLYSLLCRSPLQSKTTPRLDDFDLYLLLCGVIFQLES